MGFEETHEKMLGHSNLKSAVRAIKSAGDDMSIADAAIKVETELVKHLNANTVQWRLIVIPMLRSIVEELIDAPALYFREVTRHSIRRRLAAIEQSVTATIPIDSLRRYLDSAFEVLDVTCMTSEAMLVGGRALTKGRGRFSF